MADNLMEIKGFMVALCLLTFLGIILPSASDSIVTGNSTLTEHPAYPFLKVLPFFTAMALGVLFIYWAYEEKTK